MERHVNGTIHDMSAYHPTVWRTCRVLANTNRLRCLRVVLEQPSSTVGEIAERTEESVCHASLHLRALQARGMIEARRQSRWVHYVPVPDPLVVGSAPLLAALRQVLVKECQQDAEVIHTLTAFTHLRRLAILHLLQLRSPLNAEEIYAATRISSSALSRHMKKLCCRDLATYNSNKWSLVQPRDILARTLLSLLTTTS